MKWHSIFIYFIYVILGEGQSVWKFPMTYDAMLAWRGIKPPNTCRTPVYRYWYCHWCRVLLLGDATGTHAPRVRYDIRHVERVHYVPAPTAAFGMTILCCSRRASSCFPASASSCSWIHCAGRQFAKAITPPTQPGRHRRKGKLLTVVHSSVSLLQTVAN